MKENKRFGRWTKNLLSAAIIAACGMTSVSAFAGHGPHSGHDKGGSTPFARIVKMPVVKVRGRIDYAATYARAKEVATAIGMYIANTNDASASGFPADWIVGGLEVEVGAATEDDVKHATLAIPSPFPVDPNDSTLGIKKANVLDMCNPYYAKKALGVTPITGDKKVVNGYSHATALPCQIATWNDDKHIYVDMLDPNSIFSLFFSDVLVSADMLDPEFAAAMMELPENVKDEIKTVVYNALDAVGYDYNETDQKIGPGYKGVDDILDVVENSPYGSPYKHVAYTIISDTGEEISFSAGNTNRVATLIIDSMTRHGTSSAGIHEPELESILSPGSSWRSARQAPLGLPGKPEKNWVIEACSPKYAKMAMGTGLHHVTALPCEISVQRVDRDGNGTTESLVISYLDPGFMLGSLFADISDEDKEAMAWVPPTILTDLENIVGHALTNYETEEAVNLNDGVQFYNKMY